MLLVEFDMNQLLFATSIGGAIGIAEPASDFGANVSTWLALPSIEGKMHD
jgi:hypothetical protein